MKTQLKKDEKLILETKLHWFTMIVPFLILIAGVIVGFILLVYSGYYLLITLVTALFFYYKLVERSNNIWAVTNLRIVDEFGVFSNNSKESPLDKINNVTYNQSFWGKIFGYGNVQIQTAAEIGSTTYSFVENPSKLKDTITRMQEEYKDNQVKRQASELANAILAGQQNNKTDVPAELERLFDLKQRGIITEEEFLNRKAKILNS
ncbi:MAG: PH domain-containing protein [Bacteroidales bacterium]|jgi:uncharacterized membrane protein YdbT with pleckstrin-like domain